MTEENYRRWDTAIKALTIPGIFITLIFGLYQHFSNQEREFKAPFWNERFKTCLAAATISGKIAASSEKWIPSEDIERLFNIYYGPGLLTLDSASLDALRRIGNKATRCNSKTDEASSCERGNFNMMAYEVSEACREALATSWELPLHDFGKRALNFDTTE